MRSAALVITLFAFWLVLSGMYTPFLVLSGLSASITTAALAWRMRIADPEGHPVHLVQGAVAYWPWLLKEVLLSGWHVSRIILDPRLPISPTLTRFVPSQKSTVGLVTHANSITLTPGTVTIEAEHEYFLVHALTSAGAERLAHSEMDRRVSRFEGVV
jgi:multicomponent Na+:H+ antiporter subunit E